VHDGDAGEPVSFHLVPPGAPRPKSLSRGQAHDEAASRHLSRPYVAARFRLAAASRGAPSGPAASPAQGREAWQPATVPKGIAAAAAPPCSAEAGPAATVPRACAPPPVAAAKKGSSPAPAAGLPAGVVDEDD
jgi:hypothetical protein